MPLRIAGLGDNCIDRFLPPVSYRLAGGNAVNVAVQLARLGHLAAYYGAIGSDGEGEHLRAELLRNGVDIAGLVIDRGRSTAYTDVVTAAGGERHFVAEEFGACATYRPDHAAIERMSMCDHVHIGWLNDGGAAKQALRRLGMSVSQDLSVNNAPDNLDPAGLSVAFVSSIPSEAKELARHLLQRGALLAVVTMGAAGSLAFDGRQQVSHPAVPIEPVDTTGAGDSFIAGFLTSLLSGCDLRSALAGGAVHASHACLHLGGFRQDPRPL